MLRCAAIDVSIESTAGLGQTLLNRWPTWTQQARHQSNGTLHSSSLCLPRLNAGFPRNTRMKSQYWMEVASLVRRVGTCSCEDVARKLPHINRQQAQRALEVAAQREYLSFKPGKWGTGRAGRIYAWAGTCTKDIDFVDVVEVALKSRCALELTWAKISRMHNSNETASLSAG